MFTATVRPIANRDLGERKPPVGSATFAAPTLKGLSEAFCEWRDMTGLGGGNMPETAVIGPDGKIGRLAYNGRVFGTDDSLVYDNR